MMIKKLDWNEYHAYIDKLSDKIKESDNHSYKFIAGVDSDDMIVAVHLSHKLNLPVITDMNLLTLFSDFSDAASILIVSNVVETGDTFNKIQEDIGQNFDTAVLFKDKQSNYDPTYCVEIPDARIYFPWQKCGI